MTQRFSTDVLVIGGGAAGLSAALHLADDARVTVLCKGGIESASSHWAQGGVASVIDPGDSLVCIVKAGASLTARDTDVLDLSIADSTSFVFTRAVSASAPPLVWTGALLLPAR